jgi:hypothetical protein
MLSENEETVSSSIMFTGRKTHIWLKAYKQHLYLMNNFYDPKYLTPVKCNVNHVDVSSWAAYPH